MRSATDRYSLDALRTAWRDAALALWRQNIRDTQPGYPGDRERIADLYRRIGWGWAVEDGYAEGAGHEWCGVGQAAAGLELGDHLQPDRCVPVSLHPDIARLVLPSTNRLYSHRLPGTDRWKQAGVPPAHEIDVEAVDAGDICTIYPDRKRWGSHIVMATGHPRNGHIPTVECNAHGRFPTGDRGEGAVRRKRKLEQVAVAYRLFDPHFLIRER